MVELREVMTRDPVCCTPASTLHEVAKLMLEFDCGELPVVDDTHSKNLIGVITDRDIVMRSLALGENPLELRARDCMSSPVLAVSIDASLEECLQLMQKNQVRRLPVVDPGGSVWGIISQADIARVATAYDTASTLRQVSQPHVPLH